MITDFYCPSFLILSNPTLGGSTPQPTMLPRYKHRREDPTTQSLLDRANGPDRPSGNSSRTSPSPPPITSCGNNRDDEYRASAPLSSSSQAYPRNVGGDGRAQEVEEAARQAAAWRHGAEATIIGSGDGRRASPVGRDDEAGRNPSETLGLSQGARSDHRSNISQLKVGYKKNFFEGRSG